MIGWRNDTRSIWKIFLRRLRTIFDEKNNDWYKNQNEFNGNNKIERVAVLFNFKWYKRFFLFTMSGTYLKKFDQKDWETTKIKFIRLYCFVTG